MSCYNADMLSENSLSLISPPLKRISTQYTGFGSFVSVVTSDLQFITLTWQIIGQHRAAADEL